MALQGFLSFVRRHSVVIARVSPLVLLALLLGALTLHWDLAAAIIVLLWVALGFGAIVRHDGIRVKDTGFETSQGTALGDLWSHRVQERFRGRPIFHAFQRGWLILSGLLGTFPGLLAAPITIMLPAAALNNLVLLEVYWPRLIRVPFTILLGGIALLTLDLPHRLSFMGWPLTIALHALPFIFLLDATFLRSAIAKSTRIALWPPSVVIILGSVLTVAAIAVMNFALARQLGLPASFEEFALHIGTVALDPPSWLEVLSELWRSGLSPSNGAVIVNAHLIVLMALFSVSLLSIFLTLLFAKRSDADILGIVNAMATTRNLTAAKRSLARAGDQEPAVHGVRAGIAYRTGDFELMWKELDRAARRGAFDDYPSNPNLYRYIAFVGIASGYSDKGADPRGPVRQGLIQISMQSIADPSLQIFMILEFAFSRGFAAEMLDGRSALDWLASICQSAPNAGPPAFLQAAIDNGVASDQVGFVSLDPCCYEDDMGWIMAAAVLTMRAMHFQHVDDHGRVQIAIDRIVERGEAHAKLVADFAVALLMRRTAARFLLLSGLSAETRAGLERIRNTTEPLSRKYAFF